MTQIIDDLQEKLMIKTEQVELMHATFDKLQLSIFQRTKHNSNLHLHFISTRLRHTST